MKDTLSTTVGCWKDSHERFHIKGELLYNGEFLKRLATWCLPKVKIFNKRKELNSQNILKIIIIFLPKFFSDVWNNFCPKDSWGLHRSLQPRILSLCFAWSFPSILWARGSMGGTYILQVFVMTRAEIDPNVPNIVARAEPTATLKVLCLTKTRLNLCCKLPHLIKYLHS